MAKFQAHPFAAFSSDSFFAHRTYYLQAAGGGTSSVEHTVSRHSFSSFTPGIDYEIGIVGSGFVFAGDPVVITAGLVTEFFETSNLFKATSATDIAVDATVFLNLVAAKDWTGLWAAAATGDDAIKGGLLADTIKGMGGNDTIHGGDGDDGLVGGDGDDSLNGEEGADVLHGGAGKDTERGGAGNDLLFGSLVNPDGSFAAGSGDDALFGEEGDDAAWGGDENDVMDGGAGNDALVGGAGIDTLRGGDGADFLFGGDFSLVDGSFVANSGGDNLYGGSGDDALYGFDGGDLINGDDGADYIEGGDGEDFLDGGEGSDFVLGGAGEDSLTGGAGFDYLYGGGGGDRFTYKKGDSADWILDFNAAEGDKLIFEGFGLSAGSGFYLEDFSTAEQSAVRVSIYNSTTFNYDDLTVFGVAPSEFDITNLLFV